MAQTEDILNCKWKESFQTISRREGWTQKMCLQTNMTKSFTRKTVRLCYYPEITSRITRLILRLNAGFPIVGAWGGGAPCASPILLFVYPHPPPYLKADFQVWDNFWQLKALPKLWKNAFYFTFSFPVYISFCSFCSF